MSTPTFTKTGTKATTAAKLDASVFGVEINNHELVKLAYDAHLANGRENLALVKTRGLVRGGGKKPWKQKGTGRARFGSSRNPIWRGGGIVFGPTGEENYSKHVNTKAKRLAIRQALTMAAQADKFIIVEDVEAAKTAVLASFLTKVGATGRTLLVVDKISNDLALAARNLSDVKLVSAAYVNVFDTMNADKIVLSKTALEALTARVAVEAAKKAEPSAKKADATAEQKGEK
jgi:large subunit ribosomal protein L4